MYYYIKFKIYLTMIKLNRLFTGLFLSAHLLVQSQIQEMNISTYKPGAPIQPTMYGLFFEDINYGADGGLYAELIKNRSFEFPQSLMGWQTFEKLEVKNDGPFERNLH
jgi:alpha-N-arabinofuranosidase